MTKAVELAQVASTGVSEAFKNRIINGAMVIDQRNAGASVSLTDGLYFVDRWKSSISQTSKITGQRSSTAPTGFTNSILATVSTAFTPGAGDYAGLVQPIEGFNVADLGWGTANAQTITLSFWVRSSITGTYSVALHNDAFNRSYVTTYTVNSANTWEQKSVTITGDTTGTWTTNNTPGITTYFALGMGSTYGGATANIWNASAKLAVTGQTQWVSTLGATFYITGVQLEVGSTATSFDYRPYTTELQLCQRYLPAFRSTASTYDYIAPVFSAGGTGLWVTFQFLVTARVPPTGITSSGMSTFSALIGGTQYTTSAATLTSVRSTNGALVEFTGTPPTAGYGGFFRFDNSGTGYIYFTGCEL